MSGPKYIIFVGMNNLKTLQRLATTFLKYREILVDNKKSERKPWKTLAKEYIGKVADSQPATLSKKRNPLFVFFK